MSTIREFENVLHRPQEPGSDEKLRYRLNEEEKERMKSAEAGGTTTRLRHPEQQQQQQPQQVHVVEKEEKKKPVPSSGPQEHHHGGLSSLIDDEKIKMIQEKGSEAKKAFQHVFSGPKQGWGWMKWPLLGLLGLSSLMFLGFLTMFGARTMLPYPSHASCQVNLTFYNDEFLKRTPICEAVKSAFVHQMKEWETKDNCKNGGMKCLYKVTHVGDDEITGTHQTSDWFGFTDDLTFKFRDTEEGDCFVEAYSRSKVPFAYFDFGVNYCNIYNLVEGMNPGKYQGVTSDEVCTQYSSVDCEKY